MESEGGGEYPQITRMARMGEWETRLRPAGYAVASGRWGDKETGRF